MPPNSKNNNHKPYKPKGYLETLCCNIGSHRCCVYPAKTHQQSFLRSPQPLLDVTCVMLRHINSSSWEALTHPCMCTVFLSVPLCLLTFLLKSMVKPLIKFQLWFILTCPEILFDGEFNNSSLTCVGVLQTNFLGCYREGQCGTVTLGHTPLLQIMLKVRYCA